MTAKSAAKKKPTAADKYLTKVETALAEARALIDKVSDLQRFGVRIRLRREHGRGPERVDQFCCWVVVFKDGHEEIAMPLTTQPKGLPSKADVRKQHGADDVKAFRIARYTEEV